MFQLSGRPLLDNQLDAALVIGRDDAIGRIVTASSSDLNVLVVGERGSGRTTVLRQVARTLRQRGVHAQWIDAGTALTPPLLVELVTTRLLNGSGSTVHGGDEWPLQRLLSAPPTMLPPVVLLDGAVASAAYGLFGTLRDELWQLPIRWTVTCTDRDRATLLRPPADAFFDVVVSLPALREDDARALVRARVPDGQISGDTLATIVDIGGGNPRALLSATRAVLDGAAGSPEQLVQTAKQRDRRLSTLSPAAARLVADLEASGPASASDPGLLARNGWTRSRAAQLLRELLEAGLVETTTVRHGPGRPRTVYTAVTVRP